MVSISLPTAGRDHPRIHGEYAVNHVDQRVLLGSPPYTRGIHGGVAILVIKSGITPVYTGNTLLVRPCLARYRDHPRIHGEYAKEINFLASSKGSPPYTRGIPDFQVDENRLVGITPVYTGNTPTA